MIPDPYTQQLADQAAGRQATAHRPGTRDGRASALRAYLSFCDQANLNYKRPTYFHACWFIEHMVLSGHSPGSISNTISHLRTYYKLAGLNQAPWHHYRVGLALRSVAINIRHVPNPKLPINPGHLKAIFAHISKAKSPRALRVALLLMYMGFMRQSSVAPLTKAAFDPTRHLTPQDVTSNPQGLKVKLKWTKTIQRSSDAKTLLLTTTKNPGLCPVNAYNQYIKHRAPPPKGPLLIHADGNPLTTRFIARQWTELVKQAGLAPASYSLHSLRRGAAEFTYNKAKADLNDVMTQGTWWSLAVRAYIKPPDGQRNSVHEALSRI